MFYEASSSEPIRRGDQAAMARDDESRERVLNKVSQHSLALVSPRIKLLAFYSKRVTSRTSILIRTFESQATLKW